ncbi:MAG: hypothetical protein KDK40_04895, partial [Chlamydiia bacterium]|nr:hypothetical protein [Chlamydiia bacterium]
HAHYQLACLYNRCGREESIIEHLEQARIKQGLPPVDEMIEDAYLDGFTETSAFKHFIKKCT